MSQTSAEDHAAEPNESAARSALRAVSIGVRLLSWAAECPPIASEMERHPAALWDARLLLLLVVGVPSLSSD